MNERLNDMLDNLTADQWHDIEEQRNLHENCLHRADVKVEWDIFIEFLLERYQLVGKELNEHIDRFQTKLRL